MHSYMHARLWCLFLHKQPPCDVIIVHFLCVIESDWKMARKQKQSPLHILEPVDLTVTFSRAMVVKDSRMSK